MIYITGDVHKAIKGSFESKNLKNNDLNSAIKYLQILKKYKLKSTLFLNGFLLDKFPEKIKELLGYDVEIGGHTYDNFGKLGVFTSYLNRKFHGCVYGAARYQKKDIQKTRKAFERAGLKMTSWRTHAFGSSEKTFELLLRGGVGFVSDLLGEQESFKDKNGITHLPINIPVDQNTIIYGNLKPENRNPFASCTKGRIRPDEWFEIVKKRISENEKNNIPSVLLIHPATMDCLDDFELFEKLAKFLSKYESGKVSEFKN
tara:strand:- start:11191 stop:11967 length:777 start_codon:yes stop_codon:yes gene_type:complete